jgi:hypothetical protein
MDGMLGAAGISRASTAKTASSVTTSLVGNVTWATSVLNLILIQKEQQQHHIQYTSHYNSHQEQLIALRFYYQPFQNQVQNPKQTSYASSQIQTQTQTQLWMVN